MDIRKISFYGAEISLGFLLGGSFFFLQKMIAWITLQLSWQILIFAVYFLDAMLALSLLMLVSRYIVLGFKKSFQQKAQYPLGLAPGIIANMIFLTWIIISLIYLAI